MRVLQIHNSYQQTGGEDVVVANEAKLLTANGQIVETYIVSNDEIQSFTKKASAAMSVGYSRSARVSLRRRLADSRPDVVHVHNTFPLLTPSVYDACRDAGVPVVQTLHNYRIGCISGTLLREDTVCEKCWNGSPSWGAVHACYRGSRIGSLAASMASAGHRWADTWNRKVTRFIALAEFARAKFEAFGLEKDKIVVKPNFTYDLGGRADDSERRGALFVGRLSPEKGILQLLEAWWGLDYPLTVIGDGPLYETVKRTAPAQVTLAGRLSSEQVRAKMKAAAFVVMPSTWYEMFPMVLVEAYAAGLPVLASRLGSLAELVVDTVTGLHFVQGDSASLREKLMLAIGRPDMISYMGRRARAEFERRFTPETNYAELMRIYAAACETATPRQAD